MMGPELTRGVIGEFSLVNAEVSDVFRLGNNIPETPVECRDEDDTDAE